MKKLMPVVFVGHGSPMNAIQETEFTKALSVFAGSIPKPKAIACISAHWETAGTFVTGSDNPGQIYDFYGFPQELYEIKYRPKGSVALAKETAGLLSGFGVKLSYIRGIDHGTWSVLKHMYPKCDIPVIQLSLDETKTEKEHYELAKGLADLRKQEVLILGSGNIVHNLSMIDRDQFAKKTTPWAIQFDRYVKNGLDSANDGLLINYTMHNENAAHSVPTNEHYLPMLYACALRSNGEKARYFYEGFQHSTISMRSFAFGV